MSYPGDIAPLGPLAVGCNWRLRRKDLEVLAGFVLQPRAVLLPGGPISMDSQFHVQEIPLEGRLADGTIVPGEMISKIKKYYPTLERQDESDQEKTTASQNFI